MNPLLIAMVIFVAPSDPIAAGAPRRVEIVSVEGLNADTLERRDFLEAFRGALAEVQLPIEVREPNGAWKPGDPFVNRFRPLDGAPDPGAWTLRVAMTLPPIYATRRRQLVSNDRGKPVVQSVRKANAKRRSSRRMHVSVFVLSPDEVLSEVEPVPLETSVVFPVAPPPEGGTPAVSIGGIVFPWADAGRTAGLLALEALHRRSSDLPEHERLDLVVAVRTDVDR